MTFESRVFWMVDASNKCQPIRYLNRFFQIKNIRYASSFLSREFDTGDGGIDDVNESNAADNVSGDGDRFHDFWVVSIRRDSSQRTQIAENANNNTPPANNGSGGPPAGAPPGIVRGHETRFHHSPAVGLKDRKEA